jgi:very-short-patch-repair endonuclease/restriction endonuclease S subunit/predicted nucleotidyltransferase
VNDAIDITAAQRKTVLDLLSRHLPDAEVWVYGSRANWTSKPHSDLDMVVFTTPDESRRVADLKEDFEESDLPFRVDLFVWDEIPDSFKANIRKQHVVLQAATKEVQLPSRAGWTEKKWGDLATLEYGKALRGYQNADGPYRVFGTNGPIGRHTEPLCNHPTVIVGRKGAYRGIHYSDAPCFLIDTAFYLEPKTDFDMKWAYYELLTHDINSMDSGSAIPSTSRDSFYQMPVRVPPLPEQKVIAHILGTLDDKIELNRRMNETLEGLARTIFKSWFIDFDPVIDNALRAGNPIPDSMAERAEVRRRLLDQNQPSCFAPSPPAPLPKVEGGRSCFAPSPPAPLPCFAPSPPPLPVGEVPGEGGKRGNYRGGYDFAGLVQKAREMRKKQTPAEDLFWELVRNRRFMDLKFRRQHQLGDYVADFYCHEHRLVIELDGGVHDAQHKKDRKRDAWMKAQGYTVLRFMNEQLLDDPESVLNKIAASIELPLPLGEGRGEGAKHGRGGGEGLAEKSSPIGRGLGEGIVDYHDLFPDGFEDSELGEIPKGWSVSTLKDKASKIQYGYTQSATDTPVGPHFLRITDIQGGRVEWMNVPYCEIDAASKAKYQICDGDIFVARTGASTGENIYIVNPPDAVFASYLVRLKYESPAFARYVGQYMRTQSYFDYIAGCIGGSAQPNASAQTLSAVKTVFPPEELATAFHNRARALDEKKAQNERQGSTLHAVRQRLLGPLLAGNLCVSQSPFSKDEAQ